MCVNIIGGYYCSCRGLIGYTLDDENGRNCTGERIDHTRWSMARGHGP